MSMKKRPVLLVEAREIVRFAKEKRHHEWGSRGSSIWLTPDKKPTAIPYGGGRPKSIIIIGTPEFDTTEFVGQDLFYVICSHSSFHPDAEREMRAIIRTFVPNLRVTRVKRNGHMIWQVYLVSVKKGKLTIMH